MNDNEVKATVLANCEKNEIRGEERELIMAWLELALCDNGILENINKGFMEVVAIKDGKPHFSLTPAGAKYVEGMPYV